MEKLLPLISCICITNNRVEMLQKAIVCFENQSYINKEIIISYPNDDAHTKHFIDILLETTDIPIVSVERSNEESLGNAYNEAINSCGGDYICLWDDDDWYHSTRLAVQFESIYGTSYAASVLHRILLYNSITNKSYLSFPYSWDGSILCRKEIVLANPYANLNKGEDTHIMKFLDGNKLLYHIEDMPHLYIYIYHGNNTWNYEHYKYFTDHSELLDDETNNTICKLLGHI